MMLLPKEAGVGLWGKGITSALLLLFTYQMIINYTSIKGLHSFTSMSSPALTTPKGGQERESADLLMNAADLSFRDPVIFSSLYV